MNLDWQHIELKNLKNQLATQTIKVNKVKNLETHLKIQGNEKKLANWIKELNFGWIMLPIISPINIYLEILQNWLSFSNGKKNSSKTCKYKVNVTEESNTNNPM
jgi:hypothetical protein